MQKGDSCLCFRLLDGCKFGLELNPMMCPDSLLAIQKQLILSTAITCSTLDLLTPS